MINQFIGVMWNDYQLNETAIEFYSKYFYWHQLDLKKFMSMCRNMEFEKILSANQFTPMIFMEWSARYDAQWIGVSEEMQRLEHDKLNYDANREHEVYLINRSEEVDKKTTEERIKRMGTIIDMQKEKIELLQNKAG